jgi:hypothetical protein
LADWVFLFTGDHRAPRRLAGNSSITSIRGSSHVSSLTSLTASPSQVPIAFELPCKHSLVCIAALVYFARVRTCCIASVFLDPGRRVCVSPRLAGCCERLIRRVIAVLLSQTSRSLFVDEHSDRERNYEEVVLWFFFARFPSDVVLLAMLPVTPLLASKRYCGVVWAVI